MADSGGGDETQLSFPLPPTFYYKQYTDINVKNDSAPKPPKVPVGEYSMFGHAIRTDDEIIQPLENQGIKRLYSTETNFDHISEMKKLNHSILVNYLALLDIMIEAPESVERLKKIEEIKILFINLHHLINKFRPHQARETLRMMLHRQKQQRLETAERLRSNIEKTRALLRSCRKNASEPVIPTITCSEDTSDVQMEDNKDGIVKENHDTTIKDLARLQHDMMCDIVDEIS